MSAESTSNMQRARSGKSTSYKRAHRANNRPMLVTEQAGAESVSETTSVSAEEEYTAPVALEEKPAESSSPRKNGPRFFSSANKADPSVDAPKTDPIAARLARALRGKSAEASPEQERAREKKGTPISSNRSTAAPSARPKSGFKMKYIWGMMIYLLIADFLGVWIQSYMQSHGLDAVVFTISAFQARRSTLVFLALLIIILVLMARFDLIPRSLGAAMSNSSSTNRTTSSSKAATFESKEPTPTIKQGVQGANDDLYREYRQNQRYFQKRDRKR